MIAMSIYEAPTDQGQLSLCTLITSNFEIISFVLNLVRLFEGLLLSTGVLNDTL